MRGGITQGATFHVLLLMYPEVELKLHATLFHLLYDSN